MLGLASATDSRADPPVAPRPDRADLGGRALLLPKNALRLLDEPMAPPDVVASVRQAITEFEARPAAGFS